MRASILLIWFALLGAVPASAQSWETDPAFGARRNAFGPGLHMDATGRPYRDSVQGGGEALDPVRPNVYGPGIGSDATGRPVTADYENLYGIKAGATGRAPVPDFEEPGQPIADVKVGFWETVFAATPFGARWTAAQQSVQEKARRERRNAELEAEILRLNSEVQELTRLNVSKFPVGRTQAAEIMPGLWAYEDNDGVVHFSNVPFGSQGPRP